jgi:esterase/lipase superfamily enzyme
MYHLTCREWDSGRGLVPVTPAGGSPDPAAARLDRWTIFIHGFNNSAETITKTWKETIKQLQRWQVDLGAVVLFYWPGDYSRWELLSAMNYPKTVPIAEETAELLTAYLRRAAQDRAAQDRCSPLQLSFIAHSLGSLVVLETLRLLRATREKIIINDVLLMAAAVPEGFCVPGERYGDRFSPEAKEVALYSRSDRILQFAFQIGQEIADRFPDQDGRQAVGRYGGPGAGSEERWTAARPMEGFGHGDYWVNQESIKRIARIVEPKRESFLQVLDYGDRPEHRHTLREDILATDRLYKDGYVRSEILASWLA